MNEKEKRAYDVLREHGREDLAETIAAALAEKSQEIKELWERVNRYQQILAENKAAIEYKQRAEAAEAALESARAEIARLQKEADVTFVNAAHEAIADRDRWKARAERYYKGLQAVEGLIADSHGVVGLHLNGDDAPWDELRTGGRFEEWLLDFDAALKEKP